LNKLSKDEFLKLKDEPIRKKAKVNVYEMDNYPGVFRDHLGKKYDLRPFAGRPSVKNFSEMDESKL